MKQYDLMILGPATRDVNIDYTGAEDRSCGGAVTFCTPAAVAAGAKVLAAVKISPDDRDILEAFRMDPEDVALLTFDNYPFSMLTDPTITAVEVDMHDMGVNAARFVLQRIRKPNLRTQSYVTSPCILEREST